MALKPVLASGVALVSAAAVVAATPEVLRARTLEVAPVSEGTDPAHITPGDYDLTALSMLGALNAFFGDYHGVDPLRDVPSPAPVVGPQTVGAPSGPGEVPQSLFGGLDGVPYPTDGLVVDLPVQSMVDDPLATRVLYDYAGLMFATPSQLFDQIADEMALDAWVGLIVQPVEVLAGAVGIQLNMRDGWRNVRETVGVILDLAVLLPTSVIVVIQETLSAFVRAVTDMFTTSRSESGSTVQSIDISPQQDGPVADGLEDTTVDRHVDLDVAAKTASASGEKAPAPGELGEGLVEQSTDIGAGVRDIKEKVKQARADRKAAMAEAREQRRLERADRVRPHGGSAPATETESTGDTGGDTDTPSGGDAAE